MMSDSLRLSFSLVKSGLDTSHPYQFIAPPKSSRPGGSTLRRLRSLKKDIRAGLGIGTLIIFIALVLVAAISAAVIIRTAYLFRDRAQSTATQALNEAGGPFNVRSVVGDRDFDGNGVNAGTLDSIYIVITLWVGAPAVDMHDVRIRIANGSASTVIFLNAPVDSDSSATMDLLSTSTNYTAHEVPILQPNSGWDPPVRNSLQDTNMLRLTIDMRGGGTGVGILAPAGESLVITFIRGTGPAGQDIHINGPSAFFNSRYIDLTMS